MNSILHRLDPRTKLVGMFLLLVGVFYSRSWMGTASMLFVVSGLAAASQAGWKIWFQGFHRFRWMLLAVFAVNLFSGEQGRPITVLGHELPLTWEGLETSLVFTIQIALVIGLSMTLMFTTSATNTIKAIEKLAQPLIRLRVPVGEYSLVLLLALRFVPLVQMELQTIVEGQKSRGVDFGTGSIVMRLYNLIAVLVPALQGVARRADLLATAMRARGFVPGKERSSYHLLAFSKADYVACLSLALFFLFRALLFA